MHSVLVIIIKPIPQEIFVWLLDCYCAGLVECGATRIPGARADTGNTVSTVTNNNKNAGFIEGDEAAERAAAADIQYWHPLTPTY